MSVRIYHDGFRIVRMDLRAHEKRLVGDHQLTDKLERTGNRKRSQASIELYVLQM